MEALAKIEGDFVVFIIGARINRWHKLPRFLWFMSAMPKMLKELEGRSDIGFLGFEQLGLTNLVQYWRSMEHLVAYSRNRDLRHQPDWVRYNKELAKSGDVGIWHETYQVRAGEYECVYNNMPPFGLAKATTTADAEGADETAMGRMGREPVE